jgi:hypothetical protein
MNAVATKEKLDWVLGLTSLSDRRDRHSRRAFPVSPGTTAISGGL